MNHLLASAYEYDKHIQGTERTENIGVCDVHMMGGNIRRLKNGLDICEICERDILSGEMTRSEMIKSGLDVEVVDDILMEVKNIE